MEQREQDPLELLDGMIALLMDTLGSAQAQTGTEAGKSRVWLALCLRLRESLDELDTLTKKNI